MKPNTYIVLIFIAIFCTAAAGISQKTNETQETNNQFVESISQKIAGHENEPAAKVFKNIKLEWLGKVSAGRFLRIMNMGYSRALGVTCTHCHVEKDFSSDHKRPKRAAREMAMLHKSINEQLSKMENLATEPTKRFINCTTCHDGKTNPMQ